jgi:hypothetical protein
MRCTKADAVCDGVNGMLLSQGNVRTANQNNLFRTLSSKKAYENYMRYTRT